LIIVGEWMPVTVFSNTNGKLSDNTQTYFSKKQNGWWNKLLVGDYNQDGKPDLVIGNLGLNSQCRASDKQPAELYYKDFDDNGSVDPILCFYMQGKSYPYVTRDELLDQISLMRTRFPDYKSYADATLTDIFTPEELNGAGHLYSNNLRTSYFESDAQGKFREKSLPLEVQFAPVYAITTLDYNQDGKQDLLLGGNMNQARLRFGKYDANYGTLLKGNGKGQFTYVPQTQSGINIKGDVRSILNVNNTLLFGINQQPIKAYKVSKR
jgi:enediyne biosynthesis protein E4